MKIIITGGAGFVGLRLARSLLAQGSLSLNGQAAEPITKIVLVDRAAAPAELLADTRLVSEVGDLLDQLQAAPSLLARHSDVAAVFHLAAAVSGECEANFDLGMRSNYACTHALLEACRTLGSKPTVFFASSIAVFGHTDLVAIDDPLTDFSLPHPQTSYGIQKVIGEHLVADYDRKGFIVGRSARLATVTVRAGLPNGAASGFFSGMVREPLKGIRCTIPVPPETRHPLSSVNKTVEGIIRCVEAASGDWGPRTAINLPSVCCSVAQMAQALKTVAGDAPHALLDWKIDPVVAKIVAGWPRSMSSARAHGLGLQAHGSFEEIVQLYMAENHPELLKKQ
jgi:D-erythronate 2-dehydrogenase